MEILTGICTIFRKARRGPYGHECTYFRCSLFGSGVDGEDSRTQINSDGTPLGGSDPDADAEKRRAAKTKEIAREYKTIEIESG